MGGVVFVILAIGVLTIAGIWQVFTKAGAPGWAAIVPFYNLWTLVKVARMEPVMFILLLIPIVNIAVLILVSVEIAKAFRQTTGFGVGLALLPFIFYPVLGFGDGQYQWPSVAAVSGPATFAAEPPPERRCSACGESAAPDDRFCIACGTAV